MLFAAVDAEAGRTTGNDQLRVSVMFRQYEPGLHIFCDCQDLKDPMPVGIHAHSDRYEWSVVG